MNQEIALDLTCCCGARLTVAARWPSEVRNEREAFNERHADCRPAPKLLPQPRPRIPLAGRRA